jgi:ATPase subunit of ABC transporter with duplicated ATPase domains
LHVQLEGVSRSHGATIVLNDVTLTIGPSTRLGVVGPNGVGKTTLLRLLAGIEEPDRGRVLRAPAGLNVGLLEQERERIAAETVSAFLRRRTGVAAAEADLAAAADAIARGDAVGDSFDEALGRLLALGGGDVDARARATLARVGLPDAEDALVDALSGGETARLALAAILLARFDVLLLDEPTNDLDAAGLELLESFARGFAGGLVVVSHDRAFLDETVSRIAAIDPRSRTLREWSGDWSAYAAARDRERQVAYARFSEAQERRRELTALLSQRHTEARSGGAGLGDRTGGADRRGTHALMTKVRQTERLLERNPVPEKPFEPWELQLTLRAGTRPGDVVVALHGAEVERGAFRLGPIDLEVAAADRLALVGPNGAGKSTLLAALVGELPLTRGARVVGRSTVIGAIGQEREAYTGVQALLDAFCERTALQPVDARTLLAKFGLGDAHVGRACVTLSPGERTRALLAELQQRAVNLLVLDEPTNHLDLEAVEQLELALDGFDGALVVVSHDRRFLQRIAPTRTLEVRGRVGRAECGRTRDRPLPFPAAHGCSEAQDLQSPPR